MLFKQSAMALVLMASTAIVQAEITIESAWARLLPPGVSSTAGYLEITSSETDRLLTATSKAATVVEIHQTEMKDGMMSMSPVQAVELPAGKQVSLKPGGHHLMIMGLMQPLKEGESLPIDLQFEKAGTKQVQFKIEAR